ncbi:hypothetical protein JTE90_000311 [Oedothorax gibbosus]|uniref:Uncharacterized protein n=1 Tax=Oedothorax gibbosus TaxID=931172 RepID=A0AAV6VS14_9ARAC|nr:hypothetical protein JTE90_000311 [Oedothorax gibbosus]
MAKSGLKAKASKKTVSTGVQELRGCSKRGIKAEEMRKLQQRLWDKVFFRASLCNSIRASSFFRCFDESS